MVGRKRRRQPFGALTSAVMIAWLASFLSSDVRASSNYNVYNYDMAPTFTPDGRLLQVEYASAAAELSSPMIAFQVGDDTTCETLVLMTCKNKQQPQNRILILPSGVCIAMSGVLADSISLVKVALKEASKHKRQTHAAMTVLQLATAMADACQSHSFGGGIRPFGSTVLVCGFSMTGNLAMFQTDPSGSLTDVVIAASQPNSAETSRLCWIVGGNPNSKQTIQKRMKSMTKNSSLTLSEKMISIGEVLLKEARKQQSKSGDEDPANLTLEIVVMNKKVGCHRLSKTQIHSILERAS